MLTGISGETATTPPSTLVCVMFTCDTEAGAGAVFGATANAVLGKAEVVWLPLATVD